MRVLHEVPSSSIRCSAALKGRDLRLRMAFLMLRQPCPANVRLLDMVGEARHEMALEPLSCPKTLSENQLSDIRFQAATLTC